jgi:hypothetical protein
MLHSRRQCGTGLGCQRLLDTHDAPNAANAVSWSVALMQLGTGFDRNRQTSRGFVDTRVALVTSVSRFD